MATGTVVTNKWKAELAKGNRDWDGDTIKAMLLTASHSNSADDDFVADISANEVSDASYSRVTVSGASVAEDDANDQAELDADNPVFTGLNNVTVDYIAFYAEVTNDSDSPIISVHGIPQTVANGTDFEVAIDAEGVVKLT